jgi:hypothetical protein
MQRVLASPEVMNSTYQSNAVPECIVLDQGPNKPSAIPDLRETSRTIFRISLYSERSYFIETGVESRPSSHLRYGDCPAPTMQC